MPFKQFSNKKMDCLLRYHFKKITQALIFQHHFEHCRNLNLELATKAKGCKVAGQEGSPGVMPHALGSARECEGIDPHTPKGTPALGVGVPVDSQVFKGRLQGSKLNSLKNVLYH